MIGVNTNLHLHERFTVIGTNSNLDLFVKLADPWYYLSPGPHTRELPFFLEDEISRTHKRNSGPTGSKGFVLEGSALF